MINYYFVGGFVRDELLGIKSKDVDFAVEAPSYEAMRDDILARGYIIFIEKPEYFTIRGKHPQYGGVDFVLCRRDGYYSDNRRPDTVEVGTIYDDLARRDFTINAIAKTENGKYVDPHGGRIDLEKRVLRCVGDTNTRLTEDPLRILRALRFRITKNFLTDAELYRALDSWDIVSGLKTVAVERIYEELRRCYEFDTWKTMRLLAQLDKIERTIFDNIGLTLLPVVDYSKLKKHDT